MEQKVNFSGRALDYTEEEIDAVVTALRTANPLTQGHYLREFEEKFKAFNKAEYAFAVNNGTSALEITAQLCSFKKGDEVIIPSHTFTSSAYPFLKKGASIVWADVDLSSRVVTAKTIENCLTPKTKAIVVVHLYGYVADMPEIMELAREKNLLVIEDACQAIGADIDGIKAGSFGDFGIFSFHSHKNLTTLGEGGMLIVKDKKYAEIIPLLRHNGHCGFEGDRPDYWVPAMGNVDFPLLDGEPLWPNNYCLGEVECAVGIKQLDRVLLINEEKRKRAIAFMDALSNFPELVFHREDSTRHNYHLLAARMDGPVARRDDFIRRMFNDYGVKCVVQYYPLNRYPFYKKVGLEKANCPNGDTFFDHMISFPFQHNLTQEEYNHMLESTKRVLEEQRTKIW